MDEHGAAPTARYRFPRHAGDVLTVVRLAATPLFVVLALRAPRSLVAGLATAAVFAGIAVTDFLDGRLARRAGGGDTMGRLLDHGADILFVLGALATYVALGLTPWWVPGAIAAAFASYAYGSWREAPAHDGGQRAPSRIGHTGGVLNYALIGVLVCNNSAALHVLSPQFLEVLYTLVPLYSGAAILQRWRRVPWLGIPARRADLRRARRPV